MIARRIAYNVIVSGGAKVLSIALALFGIGMLARYLGPDGFGKYTLTLAFLAFFAAFGDLGLYPIATREISRKDADESEVLSKILTLRFIISGFIFACAAFFVWFLPYPLETRQAIFIIAFAFVFSSGYGFLNGLFQKHLAMDRVALAELIGKVIQMSTIVILVWKDLGFLFSVIAILLAMMSNFILIFWFSRSFVRLRPMIDIAYWQSFLKESLPMGVSAIATFLYFKVDAILLSLLQNDYAVGVYGAAYKIIETLVFFPAMVVGLVFPLFSRYIFTHEKNFLQVANTTVKFFLLILIPLVVSVQFLATEIIHVIGGDAYNASIPVLQILIFALASIFFGQLFTNILIAANLQRRLMVVLLIAAVGNIVANSIFIPLYSYTGAAAVSVGTELFVTFAALFVALRKTPYTLHVSSFLSLCLAAAALVAAYLLLPGGLLLKTIVALAVYGTLIFVLRIVTIKEIKSLLPERITARL